MRKAVSKLRLLFLRAVNNRPYKRMLFGLFNLTAPVRWGEQCSPADFYNRFKMSLRSLRNSGEVIITSGLACLTGTAISSTIWAGDPLMI
jgi:hypothetical protein